VGSSAIQNLILPPADHGSEEGQPADPGAWPILAADAAESKYIWCWTAGLEIMIHPVIMVLFGAQQLWDMCTQCGHYKPN